ncbi:MAG TPA: hypothetical protein DCE78_07445 [Bacteroidetes bacterium]|nr:hypothetical protein [Bacteroidota bacterium]
MRNEVEHEAQNQETDTHQTGTAFGLSSRDDWAQEHGIELRFIQPGKPNQNAFIERFNKSYREEVLDANLFNTLSEVRAATDEWVMDYNEFRPHESLGRVPPTMFMSRFFKQEISISDL